MMLNNPLNWNEFLDEEKKKNYFKSLTDFISAERSNGKIIYPQEEDVFSAFKLTPLASVKVVILGQDPYHGPHQAHGLAFSVLPNVKPPPSLVNIYKELVVDLDGFTMPIHGYLASWAKQGVFLLNSVLTVEEAKAHSHAKKGWERFTDKVISVINDNLNGVVFLLWGAPAQKKGQFIDRKKHFVLTSAHPSPLSAYRGFFGCRHFSKTNAILCKQNKHIINWQPDLIVDD